MKLPIIFMLCVILNSDGFTQTSVLESSDKKLKILMVLSNAGYYGNSSIMTANHFGETVVPYDIFVSAGYVVDFVSPKGGRVPIGYINTSDDIMAQYIHDHDFMDKLNGTKTPTEIYAGDYIAIFYSGGGSAMFGVPDDSQIQKIAMAIYEKNKGVISSICHGTAGLVNLKTSDGAYLVKNKKVSGFPDYFENMDAEYYKQFPFSIQKAIKDKQGNFVYTEERGANYFVVDGRLVTGQDPSSARSLSLKIIEILGTL